MAVSRITVTAAPGRAGVDLACDSGYGRVDAAALVPRLLNRTECSARVALVAGGAMLLGGDDIELHVHVGPGATLDLEDIGGTVAYPGPGQSRWGVTVNVGDGGLLRWAGKPLIVADGAEVSRRTTIRLGADARVLLRETTVLGRAGELGGVVALNTDVADADGPVLVEELRLAGGLGLPGVTADHRVVDAVLALGFRPTGQAMQLHSPGALARHLGDHTHDSPLDAVWQSWFDQT